MGEYYHVSYNELKKGQVLDLSKSKFKQDYSGIGLYSDRDVRQIIQEFFPNGISQHGINYLSENFAFHAIDDDHYIDYDLMVEYTFEYMRRLKFDKLPSRFESVFACKSLSEALKMKESYRQVNNVKIYKIVAETSFEADMNLLKMGKCIMSCFALANKYWSGKDSEKPFKEVLLYGNVTVIDEISI